MSNEIIRVDHQALEQVAGKFGSQSQAMAQMLHEVQRAYQPLKSGGWIGQGSTAFCNEMDSKILPALQRLIAALQQASRTTNEVRSLMREADQDASANFRNDNGNSGAGVLPGGIGNGALGSGGAGDIGANGTVDGGLGSGGGTGGTDPSGSGFGETGTGGSGLGETGVGGGGVDSSGGGGSGLGAGGMGDGSYGDNGAYGSSYGDDFTSGYGD
ncbi:MAG TPA: WXG100 family type VII secretion target, partial [Caldilineaceae bacterium]|nr:WXG100 family type VII secretion target [Caldilineaceae bacterium]